MQNEHAPSVAGEATRPTHIRWLRLDWVDFTYGRIYVVERWEGSEVVIFDDTADERWTGPECWEPAEPPTPTPPPELLAALASPATAHSILLETAEIVAGARNTTHGEKERSFGVIAALFNAYLDGRKDGGPISPRDVAALMVLLKLARSVQGTAARDHFVDAAGYAAIAGELAAVESPGVVASATDQAVQAVRDVGETIRDAIDQLRREVQQQGRVVA